MHDLCYIGKRRRNNNKRKIQRKKIIIIGDTWSIQTISFFPFRLTERKFDVDLTWKGFLNMTLILYSYINSPFCISSLSLRLSLFLSFSLFSCLYCQMLVWMPDFIYFAQVGDFHVYHHKVSKLIQKFN